MSLEQFQAKVIEHSVAPHGGELITFQLKYPRFIHAEAKTHRVIRGNSEEVVVLTQDASFMHDPMLSRNAASSRAIPVAKMIAQVRENPAMPIHWGKNQPGMQANEQLAGADLEMTKRQWRIAAERAADSAELMMQMGAHKQVANRILEPFQLMQVIVTATEWDNFFELRDHPDAQPEIRHLASLMKAAKSASTPIPRGLDRPDRSPAWHLPYVTQEERDQYHYDPVFLAKLSTARCARVSYMNHDGTAPNPVKDIALFWTLVGSRPLHASPTEHQGRPYNSAERWCKNFRGWHQFRADVEEQVARAALADHEGADCD